MKKYFLIISLFLACISSNAQNAEMVNKPLENFEAFWKLFHDNYAFFEHKKINWDSIGQVHRPLVNSNTTDEELFDTFCEMIKSLEDSHVNLITKNPEKEFSAEKKSRIKEELKPHEGKIRKMFQEMIVETLSKNDFKEMKTIGKEWNGFPLFWYGDNGKVGYLRIGRCFNHILFKRFGIKKKLNTIFKSFDGLESIIIDIRMNPGGTDEFSKAVAGRLTDKKVVAYHKQTRTSSNTFGELDTHYVEPKGKDKFLKPVYLLTNDKSISAADVMALMMAELENVTIIGENSNGSYSDIFAKKLPNKWTVTLSNQRYLSTSMENYEGTGTPVDLEVKNMRENYEKKKDLILLEALELTTK